jgi:NAD+ diphosphatase
MIPVAPIRLGYSVNSLRRDGELRTEASLAEALGSPEARVYLASGGQWLCRGGEMPDPAFTVGDASAILGDTAIELLLGHDRSGAPRLAAAVDPREASGEIAPWDLRTLGMRELLSPDLEGQLAQGAHLLNWHAAARFCGRCGAPTVSEAAGFRRRCTVCNHVVFPRTDPVSIMLVHDGEGRCVLGRQPHFADGMWSCLAGFVEAGETLEDAVRRETLEEAGLTVDEVHYHSSQPWPFPGSLMIGCIARGRPGPIAFDATELEDCRWFDRAEVQAMLENRHPGGLVAPARFAIAHHLLAAFASGNEAALNKALR